MQKGDVVLVTGASTGIGRATALKCAAAGLVSYAAIRGPLNRPEAKDLLDGGCKLVELDVTSAESCAACLRTVRQEAGRIDALINNAGINSAPSSVEEYDEAAFYDVMEANYFGPARLARLVLPEMRERGKGAIINVTSQAAVMWAAMLGPYNASKAAFEAFSCTLAQEVARFGIRVCSIRPGVIVTPMLAKAEITKPKPTPYKDQLRGLNKFFTSQAISLMQPADLVADKMEQLLVTPGDWQGTYDVGKDAEAFAHTLKERGLNWYIRESSLPRNDKDQIAFFASMGLDITSAYGKAKL